MTLSRNSVLLPGPKIIPEEGEMFTLAGLGDRQKQLLLSYNPLPIVTRSDEEIRALGNLGPGGLFVFSGSRLLNSTFTMQQSSDTPPLLLEVMGPRPFTVWRERRWGTFQEPTSRAQHIQ